ncbi:ArsR/SmtB family transcription factor [Synoicihabitans lomoniglobus]|uniref:Metalloregulator ArsR/SmtB family transcription factor n=1 Tax=Synoicihabitans lomoniglobus TaxID=2909285 RepID=A0AAE9ZX42_9BACT|nr:metalloregulator ArsR/SmtB family transcription factor [Opitutaceae bacterium LMO-M01]WED64794.1 metalloregulator ArsR/SmtB family transcription factor [Opitutaceae bacterium LMO-M01]
MTVLTSISEASLVLPARLITALADPARLRILNLIRHGGEVCNCQIGPVTGYIPSKISRHLTLLKQAGLLTERREGTFIHYQLARHADAINRQLLTLLDAIATADPCLQADRASLDAHRCC